MSYILDALRKSDQQRQLGATPTLHTIQAKAMPAAPRQNRVVRNGVLAAVLVCAGIVIGWMRPWLTAPTPPAPHTVPLAALPPAPSPPVAPVPIPAMQPSVPGVAVNPAREARAPQTAATVQGAREFPKEGMAQAVPPGASPTPTPAPASSEMTAPAKIVPPPHGVVMEAQQGKVQEPVWEQGREDLPPSLRGELPKLSISFHAYSSDPAARRTMINGEMLRQGEFVAPGLSLEEITPEGVILGYKGFRFRRGVR